MLKVIFVNFIAVMLVACGTNNAKNDALEVCDCYKKANELPASDFNRTKALSKCIAKYADFGRKYMNKVDEIKEFNRTFTECYTNALAK